MERLNSVLLCLRHRCSSTLIAPSQHQADAFDVITMQCFNYIHHSNCVDTLPFTLCYRATTGYAPTQRTGITHWQPLFCHVSLGKEDYCCATDMFALLYWKERGICHACMQTRKWRTETLKAELVQFSNIYSQRMVRQVNKYVRKQAKIKVV